MTGYTINPQAAARIVAAQRAADEQDTARDLYEIPRIRQRIGKEIAAEIAARAAQAKADRATDLDTIIYNPDRDAYVRVHDADDSTSEASFFDAKKHAAARRSKESEADFAQVCEEETGMGVSPEEWERQKNERAEIRRQSHYLAHILENAGTKAYRDDAFQLWIWHVHSKVAESIPNFRRICFLPYVAAIVRSSKLAALEYFLDRHPFCRFWTFTSGQRVGIDGLRTRIECLHANRSRHARQKRRPFRSRPPHPPATPAHRPLAAQGRAQAEECLALLCLHLVTAGEHGRDPGGPATLALVNLPSRLPRRAGAVV